MTGFLSVGVNWGEFVAGGKSGLVLETDVDDNLAFLAGEGLIVEF